MGSNSDPRLKMEHFTTVVSIVTAVFITLGLTQATHIPSDDAVAMATRHFSKDYITLQGILGKNLEGTVTDKVKVVDMLLQLLEEIDLTTLCEIMANDTKQNSNEFSKVPIQSTRIDTKLLNVFRAQMATELEENAANPKPFTNAAISGQKTTSPDINTQLATNDDDLESRTNLGEASMDTIVIPATYKYHINELRNANSGLHGSNEPKLNADSFYFAKSPKLSNSDQISDNLSTPAKKLYYFPKKMSEDKQAHEDRLIVSGLPREDTYSITSFNTDPAQSKREMKEMYLRSIGMQFPDGDQDSNNGAVNTNGVKNQNSLNEKLNLKRPREQLFSRSLLLGDWLNAKRKSNQNEERNLMGNGESRNDLHNNYENYVENGNRWDSFNKYRSQKRFNPVKQIKKGSGFRQNGGISQQRFGPRLRYNSPRTTSRGERNREQSNLNIRKNQREVDYLERSTFGTNKRGGKQSTINYKAGNEKIGSEDIYPEDETEKNIAEKQNTVRGDILNKGSGNRDTRQKAVLRGDILNEISGDRENKQTLSLNPANVNEFVRNGGFNNYWSRDVSPGKINRDYYSNLERKSQSLQSTGVPRRFMEATHGQSYKNMSPESPHLPTSTIEPQKGLKESSVSHEDISAPVIESTKSSDEVRNGSSKLDGNRVFETATTQAELLTTSVAADNTSSGLNYLYTSTDVTSQQSSVSTNPVLAEEHARLPEEQTTIEDNKTTHSVLTTSKPGSIDSSNSLRLKSTPLDHKASTPDSQSSSAAAEATTQKTASLFSASTSPKMEAKMKAAITSEASILTAEDIPTLQAVEAKTAELSSTDSSSNGLQIYLAIVKQINDSTHYESPGKNPTQRLASNTTSLPSTQETSDAENPRSTFAGIDGFVRDVKINYRAEFDNFDNSSLVKPENDVSENGHQINNTSTNGEYTIIDTSSKNESRFSVTSTNENKPQTQTSDSDSEMQISSITLNLLPGPETNTSHSKPVSMVSSHFSVLETNTSQIKPVSMANGSQSSPPPFINSVVLTTATNDDTNKTAAATVENDFSKTSLDIQSSTTITINSQHDLANHDPSTYKASLGTFSETTSDSQQRSNATKAMIRNSNNTTQSNLAYDVSTSHTIATFPSQDAASKTQSLSQGLDIAKTSTNDSIHDVSTSVKTLNQNTYSTAESHQIQSNNSTTTRTISEDTTTSDKTSNLPTTTLQQTADFGSLIRPVFIDYGHNRLPTQTTTSNSDGQTPTEIIGTASVSNLTPLQTTQLDAEATARQEKSARAKMTENHKNVENTDSSFFYADRNNNETTNTAEIIQISLSQPAILGARSEVANLLRQLSSENITADRVKMIASKVAQTKANLSEINVHLLKQSALRTQQKYQIEKTPTNESVFINEKNITDDTQPLTNTLGDKEEIRTLTDSKDKSMDGMTTAQEKHQIKETPTNESVFINVEDKKNITDDTQPLTNTLGDKEEIRTLTDSKDKSMDGMTTAQEKPQIEKTPTNESVFINAMNEQNITDDTQPLTNTLEDKEEIITTRAAINDKSRDGTKHNNEAPTAETLPKSNAEPEIPLERRTSTTVDSKDSLTTNKNEEITSQAYPSINYENVTSTTATISSISENVTSTTATVSSNSENATSTTATISYNSENATSTTAAVSSNYSTESSTLSLNTSTDKTVSPQVNHIKDQQQTSFNDYTADIQSTFATKSNQINESTGIVSRNNVRPQFDARNNGYGFFYQPHENNNQYRHLARPSISQFSNSLYGSNIQENPTPDSWKSYNIALSKLKTQQFDKDYNEDTNVPEILLYSDYKKTPPVGDNLVMDYLWKARPWSDTNQLPNNEHSTSLAQPAASSHNRNIDGINYKSYQTKKLNKLDRFPNFSQNIRKTNKWGNRFNQGYYGRVFDGQSRYNNFQDDSTKRLPIDFQEMVNFDMKSKKLQDNEDEEYVTFQAEKNKQQILNQGREMKASDTKVLDSNPNNKNNNTKFPPYSGHKVRPATKTEPKHRPTILDSDKQALHKVTSGHKVRPATKTEPKYNITDSDKQALDKVTSEHKVRPATKTEPKYNIRDSAKQALDKVTSEHKVRPATKTEPKYNIRDSDKQALHKVTSGHKVRPATKTEPKYNIMDSDKQALDKVTDNSAHQVLNRGDIKTLAVLGTSHVIQRNGDVPANSRGIQAPKDFKCPGLFGHHRDPWNCQAFFICSWGQAHRVVCPQGTLFNPKESVCDWAINVTCPVPQINMASQPL